MALVAVPSHRIQSALSAAATAPSRSSISGAGGPAHSHVHAHAHSHLQASFTAQPNVSYPRTARAAPLSVLAARTSAASLQPPPTPVATRPRRPSFRAVTIPATSPRRSRTAAVADDPFADTSEYAVAPVRSLPKVLTLTYSTYAYPAVSTPRVADTSRTSKLVASVLLNRTCGRPLGGARRRAPCVPARERVYVPSCLSRVVEIEC